MVVSNQVKQFTIRIMLLLQNISWFFTGERSQDGRWSWFVCISAAVINGVNLGFVLSFGVLFPELMEYFGETGERTGEMR